MTTNKPDTPTVAVSDWLKPREASLALRVSLNTLVRMSESGQIRAMRLPSGHRRYAASDVEAILAREPWAPSGQRDDA